MTARPNYFELFGLAPNDGIDLLDLEARYRERSRICHPDRHARADEATRVKNALATSELNQAYRVLRDPIRRAEYLLQLGGVALPEKAPPALLMEMMEQREALSEARAEQDEQRICVLGAEIRGRRASAVAAIAPALDRGELSAVAEKLVELRYYGRFLEEIEAYEEAMEST